MKLHTIVDHLRANVVAYIALAVALGGGGGYAIAATRSTTIHGCVVSRTGELLIKSRCSRGENRLIFNQTGPRGAAGASPIVVSGVVAEEPPFNGIGFSGQRTSTGEIEITLTSGDCGKSQSDNLVASVEADPSSGGSFQTAQVNPGTSSNQFIVSTGDVANGVWSPANDAFSFIATC